MTVRTVVAADPVTHPLWRALAEGPHGTLFTSPPWLAVLRRTYGFVPECWIAIGPGGEPAGGLAWVTVDDPRGRRRSALPFSDRADPLTDDEDTWAALFAASGAGAEPFALRCLAGSPALGDPRLRVTDEAAWHGTPLDGGLDDLHARISRASRRNIAAADRAGVRVDVRDDLDAVRRFHGLHVRLRKEKYRLLAQPLAFFEHLWAEFAPADAIRTLLASVGDEVVAGAVFLEWNGVLYYKFGASRREHLTLRPNDAVYWAGISYGVQRGLRLVDWGLSDLDQPGLVAFKRKWATTETPLLTLRAGTAAPGPEQERIGAVFAGLTRLLTEPGVPDSITAEAGALLYRYFC
jgi:CelD/BcsL family acetyltransferase involved in cellulose biosynthesis